jgi:hypothetical protein
MELHYTKEFLCSKGNHQNAKAAYRMDENVCKPYVSSGVNIQNM